MKPKKVFNKGGGYAWLIDFYDDKGKRVKRRFKKLADAEAVLARVVVSKKEGKYGEVFGKKEVARTFDDLSFDYLVLMDDKRNIIDKTQIIKTVLYPAFLNLSLKNITYRDLELFRRGREKTPTGRGPRSMARVNREMAVLRHMLNKAVSWGWLEVNPFSKGESLFARERNARGRFLSQEDASRLLAACADHLRPIVETALNTGMRKGEILALRWEWIRGAWVYLPGGMVKSGEGRPVPLNQAQVEVFKEVRAKVELKSPYVFPGVKGLPLVTIRKGFEAACRRAGIEDFHFHDLRHTCASWLVMAGASLKAVQQQLGHATLTMTMRYAHLAPGHQQEAINLIGTRGVKSDSGNQKTKIS
jgi:integrase